MSTAPGQRERYRLVVTLDGREHVCGTYGRFELAQASVARAVRDHAARGLVQGVRVDRAVAPAPSQPHASPWQTEKRWDQRVVGRILAQHAPARCTSHEPRCAPLARPTPPPAADRASGAPRPLRPRYRRTRWDMLAAGALILGGLIALLLLQTERPSTVGDPKPRAPSAIRADVTLGDLRYEEG